VIIAAALALAVVAFFGNVYYLHGAQQRAYDNAKLVKVFVVKKAIPKGTDGGQAIAQDYVQQGDIPQQYRPGSAITDINDIKNKVALNDLSPGQVVVNGMFVDQNVAQVTFAQRVPPGQVAVTVSLDQVHAVGGLLRAGDKVDMLVVDSSDQSKASVSVMYQNVNILAIGSNAAPQAGETTTASKTSGSSQQTADSGLITLAVPLDAAQHIVVATTAPLALYLTLVPPDNQPVSPKPGVVATPNVLNNVGLTPYPNS